MKGYLQVYTGNGKGKTTAAIGLAIRAAGAGQHVMFVQFAKSEQSSEIYALERYNDLITVKQFGSGSFIVNKPVQKDYEEAAKGLNTIKQYLKSGDYQLVILDEANIALYYRLFSVSDFLNIIQQRKSECEVVVTGRKAPQELIDAADLVTEMKEIKHYYSKGVNARTGIEK